MSDGTSVENPRALERNERKLKRLQWAVSRKKKGSKNRDKAVLALERKHLHIENIRLDAIHKATTVLAKTKSVVVIENLDVKWMMKRRPLAKAIQDAAMAQAGWQLRYKAELYGTRLVVAPWWYPTAKRSSRSGNVKEKMGLTERTYHCDVWGLTIDRDLNAARNLEQWPGVARTLKTPVERNMPFVADIVPDEAGTISTFGSPRPGP